MASLQAHLVSLFVKWRMKRPLRGAVDICALRAGLARPYPGRIPDEVTIAASDGPVPGEWVIARSAPPETPVVLYLHGGAFFACSPATHRGVTATLARSGRLRVFAPDYRLAPEHRFPAALEDAVACYEWLSGFARVAAVMGDSAGGTLALSTLLRLRDLGRALPAAGVAFSPVTDLAATGHSLVENDRRDAMFFGSSIARLKEVYLPEGISERDPLASPLYADLSGLPPLLLHVGANEVLRDDTLRLAERARAAGVTVNVRVWPAVPHAWQLMGDFVPEGRESVQEAEALVLGLMG